jgi:hypothetical protein
LYCCVAILLVSPRIMLAQEQEPAAAPPATQPAAAPAQSPIAKGTIEQWFAELAHYDAAVRERARIELMGLQRNDLDTLHDIVQANLPLSPSQANVLHDIVIHVYLAGEPYVGRNVGFLGVTLPQAGFARFGGDIGDGAPPQNTAVIMDRFPGFVGYRMLQDGDVIMGLGERPDLRIHEPTQLIAAIQEFRPGETVHLKVLRGMQVIDVAVKLDARVNEVAVPAIQIDDFRRAREIKAEEFWQKTFSPLLVEPMS